MTSPKLNFPRKILTYFLAQDKTPSSHNTIEALTGLRGIAILLVFLSHLSNFNKVVPGGLGVTIFFFISGFIICHTLWREQDRNGQVSIRAFYWRRFFRLIPTVMVYISIALVVIHCTGNPLPWKEVLATLFYFYNYYNDIFPNAPISQIQSPFSITWSLSIEEQFYLVFPCLFALTAQRPALFLRITLVLVAVALVWRIHLVSVWGAEDLKGRIYESSDTRFDSLLYGVIFATLRNCWPRSLPTKSSGTSLACFVIGCLLLLACLIIRNPDFRETWRYTAIGISLALMAENMLFTQGTVNRLLKHALLTWVGKISYSLYLWHWLVILTANYLCPTWPPFKFFAVTLLSLLLAHLSWKWVEIPTQNYGRRWRPPNG